MSGASEKLFDYEVPYDELPSTVQREKLSADELARTREEVDEFLHINVKPVGKLVDEQ